MSRRKKNPPKVSAEAKEAERLIKQGMTPREAADRTGITVRQAQRIAKRAGLSRGERRAREIKFSAPVIKSAAAVRALEEHYSDLADALGWAYRTPDVVDNPVVGVPGGAITACIDRMRGRPDVRDPGALCGHLAKRAGESPGGRRPARKKNGTADATIRRFLRQL